MHMFYNAVYPKCWAEDITYTLSTPTHCQELLKFVGSHCSLGTAIIDKADVWHFVSNTHEEGHDHHTQNCCVYLQGVVLGFLSGMPMDILGVESLCDLIAQRIWMWDFHTWWQYYLIELASSRWGSVTVFELLWCKMQDSSHKAAGGINGGDLDIENGLSIPPVEGQDMSQFFSEVWCSVPWKWRASRKVEEYNEGWLSGLHHLCRLMT